MEKQYDLIFGLGPACSCSQTLRMAGLQYLSFPFDWILPDYNQPKWHDDIRRRAEILCANCEGWFERADFTYRGPHTNGMGRYFNERSGFFFLHDFPLNVSFEESFPSVAAKYARRCSRLLELIRASRNVLLMRLDRPDIRTNTPVDDCRQAREMLASHFGPRTKFDFVLMQEDESLDRGVCRAEEIEDGFLRLSLDYRNTEPGVNVMQPDFRITSTALHDRFKVRDYRTRDERSAWARKQKMRRYAKYGATNFLQYRWRKIMAALGGPSGNGSAGR